MQFFHSSLRAFFIAQKKQKNVETRARRLVCVRFDFMAEKLSRGSDSSIIKWSFYGSMAELLLFSLLFRFALKEKL
jgi:hypothetical protein